MRKKIGVDLDRTWAMYDHWRGYEHIGDPIPGVTERVMRAMLLGYHFVVFTARAAPGPDQQVAIERIERWLDKVFAEFPVYRRMITVSAVKTLDIVEIWDDIALRIEANKGRSALPRDTIWASLHPE